MFSDNRSKKVILAAHCILNQNSISDGTAEYSGSISKVVKLLLENDIGILQMPCPELLCLGLDRGNVQGGEQPVLIENTRIRKSISEPAAILKIKQNVQQLIFQIEEYSRNGFDILGIIGMDRSPSCGVNTTSINNKEVEGEGVFINELRKELEKKNIFINMIGIKALEIDKSLKKIKTLIA